MESSGEAGGLEEGLAAGRGTVSLPLTFERSTYRSHFGGFSAFTSGLETYYLRTAVTRSAAVALLVDSSWLCFVTELMSDLAKAPAGPKQKTWLL